MIDIIIQVAPVILTPTLLKRVCNNFMVVEVWNRVGPNDLGDKVQQYTFVDVFFQNLYHCIQLHFTDSQKDFIYLQVSEGVQLILLVVDGQAKQNQLPLLLAQGLDPPLITVFIFWQNGDFCSVIPFNVIDSLNMSMKLYNQVNKTNQGPIVR